MKQYLRKIKRVLKTLVGKDFFIKNQVDVNAIKHGSEYGGWFIVDNSIDERSIIYSFGVGEDASFDLSLINRYNLVVHAFDPTPKSICWVKSQDFPTKFQLHEYGLADFDGEISFNPPENPEHVSHTILDKPETHAKSITVPVKRISTILEELGHSTIDVLKMDIEGAEYQVINDIEKSDIRPKQLLIEFHHRFPAVGIEKTKSAIGQLNRIGYRIFSVSESGEEYSFVRVDI